MLLRKTIERHIGVDGEERRVPADTAELLFGGSYMFGGTLSKVEVVNNWNTSSKDAFPYRFKRTRMHSDGTITESGNRLDSLSYKDRTSLDQAVMDFGDPAIKKRAQRVEKIARRVKGTAIFLLAATGATVLTISALNAREGSQEPAHGELPTCEEVVNGTEVLIPVSERLLADLQESGASVCQIAGFEYLAANGS